MPQIELNTEDLRIIKCHSCKELFVIEKARGMPKCCCYCAAPFGKPKGIILPNHINGSQRFGT